MTMKPQQDTITLVGYHSSRQQDFKRLNEAWIKEHFEMEDADHRLLDHPEESILKPGGEIYFALEGGSVVGTCALVKGKGTGAEFQLAKMAVDPEHRGRGIGDLLGRAVIDKARQLGAETLVVETNSALAPAVRLYRKLGFVETTLQSSPFSRCDLRMELALSAHVRPAAGIASGQELNYHLLDVFTDRPFGGNPLAVFPGADDLSDGQMQSIAGELNLSETVFIQAARRKTSDCALRIFTPRRELPMAGHPTLGAAWPC